MASIDDDSDYLVVFKSLGLGLFSHFAKNYHEYAGNLLVTMSILYLGWKWWRDYKKPKA
jgi:hypothetical protein